MSTAAYQPLSPHQHSQQQRKAFTFTLMIMTVAFATLLTIIHLTLSPGLSSQGFFQPPIIDAANRDRHEPKSILLASPLQIKNEIKTDEKRKLLLSKLIPSDIKLAQVDSESLVEKPAAVAKLPKVNSTNLPSSDASQHSPNSDANSSQAKTNDELASANKNLAQSSSTAGGVTILTADQRYEKEYRDDPVTDPSEAHILAKVPRKPKLVFEKADLEETKKMRIDKKEGCGEGDGAYADLLVIVNSAAYNFEARSAIRETWGKFAVERGAYFYFLVGSTDEKAIQAKIEAEDAQYEDMLQGSFFDSYHNLTLKTISMMRWVGERCSKIRYVLKVDDDMMLNMQHICDFAEINPNFHRVIIGKLAKKWKPHRDTRNKWYVPPDAFNGTFFPSFVTGPAYFFTGDAAQLLYDTAFNDRAPLYLEDVYMTGIVAEKAGIKRYNHALIRNVHLKVDECTYPRIMTSHKHKPADIRFLWKLVYSKKCIPPKPTPTNTTIKAKMLPPKTAAVAPVVSNVKKAPQS